jgi:hypothetical protein
MKGTYDLERKCDPVSGEKAWPISRLQRLHATLGLLTDVLDEENCALKPPSIP